MYYISNIVVTRCMEECVAWLGLKVEEGKDVVEGGPEVPSQPEYAHS